MTVFTQRKMSECGMLTFFNTGNTLIWIWIFAQALIQMTVKLHSGKQITHASLLLLQLFKLNTVLRKILSYQITSKPRKNALSFSNTQKKQQICACNFWICLVLLSWRFIPTLIFGFKIFRTQNNPSTCKCGNNRRIKGCSSMHYNGESKTFCFMGQRRNSCKGEYKWSSVILIIC